jgi:hypothetical protein
MKTTLRIISMIMALICICACFASCGEKLNEDMEAMERGERMEFNEDGIISCEHSYKIANSKSKNLTVKTEIDAYNKSFEYLNCKIVVKFKATVIFDDHSEGVIDETFTIELPFEGDCNYDHKITTDKPVHSVYNETYEIVSIEGEIIKK